jgi:hypothetical protein
MRGAKLFVLFLLATGIITITACSRLLSSETSLPAWHPVDLEKGRPACSECHEDQVKGIVKPYASFSHSPEFVKNHRFYAAREGRLCATCHRGSFCNDCHTNEVEMKPPIKLGDRPDRELIHRGDWLTLHKIEGKIDPTSCYKCHGRTNNEKCVVCHR